MLNYGISGTAGAQIGSTTANSASYTTIGSGTIPAANAHPGAGYQLYLNGTGNWGSSTANQLNLQVQLGGNAMTSLTIAANAFPASASQAIRWVMTARVYCNTSGSTGTWTSEITGILSCNNTALNSSQGSTGASFAVTSNDSASPTTVDTTAAQVLNFQAQWATITGAPSVASRVVIFSRIS